MIQKKKPTKHIILTDGDYRRLVALLNDSFALALSQKPYLKDLRGELDIAEIVESGKIPRDVVTMHSIVRLRDVSSHEVDVFTLVFPREANIIEGKLSVLAPIGTAILGQRVGDVVTWPVPSGNVKVEIEEVLAPDSRLETTL
ncbi:GreA/GreB family elongation factor [Bremerella alba]|uniref:Regulator of nucleoside diphosphate kinase n=1 Tax=Bremerella alba TaxID=980252 RepID=A0A7V8V5F5_9BACT|nr:GreA/GreB family elongation factor [Bremerella alba]MBA2115309.1 Regulator of nucleoside diphosphate kinase [Bremerella alba]